MRICGHFHHISAGENLHLDEHRNGTMASFSFCPDRRKVGQVAHFYLPYEGLTELVELVKSTEVAAFEPIRRPCSKCKGWCLFLGYSYSAVMKKERLDESVLNVLTPLFSGSEERLLTLVVSGLGKGFMLSRLLERDSENRVSKVGKLEEFPLIESGKFLIFSSTPFCV